MLEEKTSLPPLSELASSIPDVLAPSFTFSFIKLNADITIDVPARLQNDPLIRALVKYYNSPWHAQENRGINALKKYARGLDLFFNNALAEFAYVPDTIGGRWINSLKRESDSENVIRALNFVIKAPIDRISKRRVANVDFSKEEIAAVSKFKKIWPALKWNRSEARKTLEQLTELDFTNADLFASLRVFCLWYVQEWASVMKGFKECMPEEYRAIKTDIDRFGPDSFFFRYSRRITKQSTVDLEIERRGSFPASERATGLEIWIKAAIILDSDLLKDMVYLAFRLARRETQPENLLFDDEKNFVGFAAPVAIVGRDQYLRGLLPIVGKQKNPQLPPATALVSPSFDMQIATAWLLASDRHQGSNLNLMTLSSIREVKNTISTIVEISSFKGRNNTTLVSAEKVKDAGAIYKNNHPIHKALLAYRKSAEEAYREGFFIKDEEELDKQLLLPFIPVQPGLSVKKQGRCYSDSDVGLKISYELESGKPRNLGLLAVVVPNIVTQQKHANGGISAFSKLLGHSMFHNEKHKPLRDDKAGSIPRTAPSITISPAYIAQTEPVAKLKREIRLSENMHLNASFDSDDQKDEVQLEAKKANHSVAVREDVYIARSNDKIKLEAESRFAQMVGDEMVAAAMSLFDIKLEKSSVLTIADVAKKLGLPGCNNDELESLETLLAESNAQDYLIDVTGLIQKNAELIVIKTPIVAALMQSYIIHIDTTLDQVFSSNEDLVEGLIAHRMFLQAMLNEFDEKTKREAKERFGGVPFPFPELIA